MAPPSQLVDKEGGVRAAAPSVAARPRRGGDVHVLRRRTRAPTDGLRASERLHSVLAGAAISLLGVVGARSRLQGVGGRAAAEVPSRLRRATRFASRRNGAIGQVGPQFTLTLTLAMYLVRRER